MKLLDGLYYYSALLMPLWFQWQWNYVMTARFYFERKYPCTALSRASDGEG